MGAAGSWTGRHRHVLLVLRKPSQQYLSIEGAGSPRKNKNWDKGGGCHPDASQGHRRNLYSFVSRRKKGLTAVMGERQTLCRFHSVWVSLKQIWVGIKAVHGFQ